ncbi:MAG: benzoate-CoA ligase family protein [Acidobacteriota bacterium]|nr:benzoate-CoA ligase family protein [Acidobacteriota bacterium]
MSSSSSGALPTQLNIADYFLDARIREGHGDAPAVVMDTGRWTYGQVQELANRYGQLLLDAGVQPEQRVIIALPDGIEYVAALFGILKIGAVVVMVNPELSADALEYFLGYTRAVAAFVHGDNRPAFEQARKAEEETAQGCFLRTLLTIGTREHDAAVAAVSGDLQTFPSHRDDPAIWLFSGGTTGKPKAVVQPHASFANTTRCYAEQVLQYRPGDLTLSVPKLFFGYATGSNLLFPFAAGAATLLFPERCTAERLYELIAKHRPTLLINVPTMVRKLLEHPVVEEQDLSCLRLATSAGEALPVALHERWNDVFGVELLDGLGTAEMWHVFLSNRPGAVRPGTLGQAVPGFELKVCDDDGTELPAGETGALWVRGDSLAVGYWQRQQRTRRAFRGEWYVTGDMVEQDEDGYFTYRGRGDDLLKVSGKWLATREVEECLAQHGSVEEAAVVGVQDENGLTVPHAFIVVAEGATAGDALVCELQDCVKENLEPYKYPRRVSFLDTLPRTHLGKIDRGKLRRVAASS